MPGSQPQCPKLLWRLAPSLVICCTSCGSASLLVDGDSGAAGGADSGAGDAADPRAPNPVAWETDHVSLSADDFALTVDGQVFLGPSATLAMRSDPGNLTYTTLELVWIEQSREMRLFIYFKADSTHWWSEEIRTYDGQMPGEWIYYLGTFFTEPLGSPYTGDLVLTNNGAQDEHQGTIVFRKLWLLPTFTPRA